MVEAKDASQGKKGSPDAEGKKGKKGKKEKKRDADGNKKESKFDPRMVKHIARAISGLGPNEWQALNKEGQKAHMKTARKVLSVQKKIGAKPPKPKGSKGEARAKAESAQD